MKSLRWVALVLCCVFASLLLVVPNYGGGTPAPPPVAHLQWNDHWWIHHFAYDQFDYAYEYTIDVPGTWHLWVTCNIPGETEYIQYDETFTTTEAAHAHKVSAFSTLGGPWHSWFGYITVIRLQNTQSPYQLATISCISLGGDIEGH